jgi:Cop9 signalosome subunit 5 C-terminal domain
VCARVLVFVCMCVYVCVCVGGYFHLGLWDSIGVTNMTCRRCPFTCIFCPHTLYMLTVTHCHTCCTRCPSHPCPHFTHIASHVAQYYSLDVSFFKSSLDSHLLDLLWAKYWVTTLATSPLLANRDFAAGQIADVAEKLEQVRACVRVCMRHVLMSVGEGGGRWCRVPSAAMWG